MIRSERVTVVPKAVVEHLRPQSAKEHAKGHQRDLERTATEILVFYEDDVPLVCCGIRKQGLIGSAEFWFLICEGYGVRHVRRTRDFAKELLAVYGGLLTSVEEGFTCGERFAEFLGFRPTSISGGGYRIYEVRV